MNKILFILFLCIIKVSAVNAQNTSLFSYEDSLKKLGTAITNDSLESNRVQANFAFIKTLVNALKEKNSFNYPFKKLDGLISIKTADDKKFRIFTWFVMNDKGAFRYYGAIQVNNPTKLELIPLFDNTDNIMDPPNTTLLPHEWFGAVYYHILPVTGIKNPYYILLGWKGKSFTSSAKVIETLAFVDGKPQFGLSVLESGFKTDDFNKRKIFNYTSSVSMMLRYLKEDKLLVFDHLAPPNDQSKELTDMFGPDLSYDAYRFRNGKWLFQENIKLKNLPEEADELFLDPSTFTPSSVPVRKY